MVFSTFPARIAMNSVGAGLSWDSNKYFVTDVSFGAEALAIFAGRWDIFQRARRSRPRSTASPRASIAANGLFTLGRLRIGVGEVLKYSY
jgi:hypothetical protein